MCKRACGSVRRACERGVSVTQVAARRACACIHIQSITGSRPPPILSALTNPSASTLNEPLFYLYSASRSQCQGEQLYSIPSSWAFYDAFSSNFWGKVRLHRHTPLTLVSSTFFFQVSKKGIEGSQFLEQKCILNPELELWLGFLSPATITMKSY